MNFLIPKFLDVADFWELEQRQKRCRIGVMDEKTNKMEKVELFFSPMLTGEYVSRIEKKAVEKLRAEFEKKEK